MCLRGVRVTVVGVGDIDDVEVGVVDGGADALEAHLVALATLHAFAVEGGLGDVDQCVHQRALSRVLAPQDHHWTVLKFLLRTRLVQKLRPH